MDRGVSGETGDVGASSNSLIRTSCRENRPVAGVQSPTGEVPQRRTIVVSFSETAEDWLATTRDDRFSDVVLLCMGDSVRSTAASPSHTGRQRDLPAGEPRIEWIPDPTDLAVLGLSLLTYIPAEQQTSTVLYFDSLDALLEAVPLRTAFRFLHILTSLVATRDATGFYYASSDIDSEQFNTIRVLFDAEYSPE